MSNYLNSLSYDGSKKRENDFTRARGLAADVAYTTLKAKEYFLHVENLYCIIVPGQSFRTEQMCCSFVPALHSMSMQMLVTAYIIELNTYL